jgi:dihydrolipoamide dehydrogenase
MYDLVIIGGGPAGYHAAIRAAQLGGRVCVVEKDDRLGGACLNRGCIPTKALVKSVDVLDSIKRSKDFGIEIEHWKVNFSMLMERKKGIVDSLTQGLAYLMKSYNIEVVHGSGEMVGSQEVRAGERVFQSRNILIAPGSQPFFFPPFFPDGKQVISTTEALELTEVPASMLIAGGGYNGCEFAHIFSSLGCKVTIIEMMDTLLPGEDGEIVSSLVQLFRKKGIALHFGEKIEAVTKENGAVRCTLSGGGEIQGEKLLVCVGRKPNIDDVGLDRVGIKVEKGRIWTDGKMQTNIPSCYAAGDVVDGAMLAHVAFKEGLVAAENALGKSVTIDHGLISHCIFTHPEIASVGLNERAARDQFGDGITIGKFPFMANGKALCEREPTGFLKVIAKADNEEILGVHIIGAHASELIAAGTLAIAKKARLKDISELIHPHPTLSELFMEASADGCGHAIHLPRKRT